MIVIKTIIIIIIIIHGGGGSVSTVQLLSCEYGSEA